ncbi:MAG: [ribosomal protein S5]-alanine N-acetyltransferase [Nocardioidaceae bacterium]|jgi:ribosomal-protein-alanine N-acetyltransferase|nr:[ribosomal protein S5]-alanine N-acetyltransferase [Nocardioidaceae bacterium]
MSRTATKPEAPSGARVIRLYGVPPAVLRALYAGSPDWAPAESGIEPCAWPEEDARVLRYRVAALDEDASSAPYLLHLVVDDNGHLLGRIGCHSGPDSDGEVEIGYFVRTGERGRGVAGQTVDRFLAWLREQRVKSVRAAVRPDNEASLRLLHRRGFREAGTQVDDEDGLELILRLPVEADELSPT